MANLLCLKEAIVSKKKYYLEKFLILCIFFKAIWNYDNCTIKTISQNSFNSMTAIIGKVWCVNENEITILNPNLLIIEVIYFIISFISLLIEKTIFFYQASIYY